MAHLVPRAEQAPEGPAESPEDRPQPEPQAADRLGPRSRRSRHGRSRGARGAWLAEIGGSGRLERLLGHHAFSEALGELAGGGWGGGPEHPPRDPRGGGGPGG